MRLRALSPLVALAIGCAGPPSQAPVGPTFSAAVAPRVARAKPVPVVLVAPSPDDDIADLVLDADRVYWAHRGERGLSSIPLAGGSSTALVPGTDHAITSLAQDSGSIYWTSGRRVDVESSEALLGRANPRAGHFEGFVGRIRKDGTGKVDVAAGRFEPNDVVVEGGNLYWVMTRPKEGTLVRMPLPPVGERLDPRAEGALSVVAHGSFARGSLVVHAGRAFWIDAGGAGTSAAPSMMMVSVAGGEPRKVVDGQAGNSIHPVRLALGDGDDAVYCTDAGSSESAGAVVKVPIRGGEASTLAAGLPSPRGIKVSRSHVYWVEKGTSAANFHDGALKRASIRGGSVETLASNLFAPDRLAVGDGHACWNEVDGSIKAIEVGDE